MIGINIGSHLDCGSSSGSSASSGGSDGGNSGVAIAASWTRQLTIGGNGHDGVSGTIQVQSA